jgi:hypothetical protein
MQFLNRCNGSASQTIPLTDEECGFFNSTIGPARTQFRQLLANGTLSGDQYLEGYRFSSTNKVIDRIISVADRPVLTEANTLDWVLDALRDCASADHWYHFEKDWD